MSDRTSHRRRARRNRAELSKVAQQLRALDEKFGVGSHIQMCERCDSQRADRQYADLLVCGKCRAEFGPLQPWRVCPESGEAIDTRTGKPFVFDEVLP